MSVAYYIVLDQADPGFDPFVNGKFLAGDARRVDKAAKKLGLKRLDDFTGYDELAADEFGIESGESEGPWFEPAEGIVWLETLLDRFREQPKLLKEPAGVISDLEECLSVLLKAKAAGARWHFALDI